MRKVTETSVLFVVTEKDVLRAYKNEKLVCQLCFRHIEKSEQFWSIVTHNPGWVKDFESNPVCFDCYHTLRQGMRKVWRAIDKKDWFHRIDQRVREIEEIHHEKHTS